MGKHLICGIQHTIPEITCIRVKGHDGNCRSRAVKGTGLSVTYTEWKSVDDVFAYHVGYQTIHPANAACGIDSG